MTIKDSFYKYQCEKMFILIGIIVTIFGSIIMSNCEEFGSLKSCKKYQSYNITIQSHYTTLQNCEENCYNSYAVGSVINSNFTCMLIVDEKEHNMTQALKDAIDKYPTGYNLNVYYNNLDNGICLKNNSYNKQIDGIIILISGICILLYGLIFMICDKYAEKKIVDYNLVDNTHYYDI